MKRKIISIMLAVAMCLSLFPVWAVGTASAATSAPSGVLGNGTENDPYRITSAADLQAFAKAVSQDYGHSVSYEGVYFKIVTDADSIDLGNTVFPMIGDPSISPIFGGIFDGNGKTITGLNINPSSPGTTTQGGNGLFIQLAEGGVVGEFSSGTVKNCYNTGAVSTSMSGGTVDNIAGSSSVAVTNCYYDSGVAPGSSSVTGATAKTATEFASGEVAWLLQNGQTDQIWGARGSAQGAT